MFTSAGMWIQQVTLGWLLYEMTGSAVLLGALNGLRAVPYLIASPIAGVAADRVDRRLLLLRAQPLLVVMTFGMGALVASGQHQVWHLFAFTLLTGIVWSFNEPVRQTLAPNLVPRHELMNAIALNSMGFNSTKILGPALAGVLILWFGAAGNFFVQSLAYTGVLVMIYLMRVPPTPQQARQSSAYANLKEGLTYIWSNSMVLALLTAALVPQLFAMPVYQALMPVFQKDVLGVGPEGLGLLLASPGIGAVMTTLVLASFAHRVRRKGMVLLFGLGMLGLCLILFSRATSMVQAMLTLVGVGVCQMLFMTITNTLLQVTVPDRLRGRVMSVYFLDRGLAPAGALLAGVSTHFIGAPNTVAIAGLMIILLAVLLAWRVPAIRESET